MNAPNRLLLRGETVTAVIPARDDAARITAAVTAALTVADEVIVVDAGSDDATATLARRAGARVLTAPLSRAGLLDHGARAATGDVLLLLDVDSTLHADARQGMRAALTDPAVVAGSFRVRYAPDTHRARFVAWVMHRANSLGLGAASAGLFIRRDAYARVGGFRDGALLPRQDLLRRAAHWGRVSYLAEHPLCVSARRLRRTPLRTLALWAMLRALDALGVTARAT